MFWTRFIELCNKAGKSPNAVAAACGVKSSGTVTGWRNGSVPRTPVLHKMADYFNVTTDYLLGNVDLPFLSEDERGILDIDLYAITETKKPTPVAEDGRNAERKQLTLEESNRLLVAMGFIEEEQDLSDDDLAFLTHIIGLLNNRFSKRGPREEKNAQRAE